MKDLLALLGDRVRKLRTAKGWSQEEFAHVSGFHRTYVGQIERGEKNLSFGNLVKLADVLDVTLSDLLGRLEEGGATRVKTRPGDAGSGFTERQMLRVQRTVTRLRQQQSELARTIQLLEELTGKGPQSSPTRTRR